MKVYLMNISESEKLSTEFCEKYFPKRFEKAQKCIKKEDRLRILSAGLLLLKMGIKEEEIYQNKYGKPFLCKGDKYFNLSHSGNYAALVSADTPVGVDIETVDAKNLEYAQKIYTADELAWMQEDALYRFHVLWTAKESILKADGTGLSVRPNAFSVMPVIDSEGAEILGKMRFCKSIKLENHVLTVCASEPISKLEIEYCKDFSAFLF